MVKRLLKCLFLVLLSKFSLGQQQATANLNINLIDLQRAVYTAQKADSAALQANAGPDFFNTNVATVNTYSMPITGGANHNMILKEIYLSGTTAGIKREEMPVRTTNAADPPVRDNETLVIFEVIPD